MIFSYSKRMSRLKKKLLLYFILISIVSISVSAEIILELGSPKFSDDFAVRIAKMVHENKEAVEEAYQKVHKVESGPLQGQEKSAALGKAVEQLTSDTELYHPITDLQVRMILLLLVVGSSIVGAFFLFARDIVTPMEGMVSATQKIAEGDLSASVPVLSEDEIGQVGRLINEMSINLQDLVLQIKSEVDRLKERITVVSEKINRSLQSPDLQNALDHKKMQVRDLRSLIAAGDDMNGMLQDMQIDLSALQAFVNLYKVFEVSEVPPPSPAEQEINRIVEENMGD